MNDSVASSKLFLPQETPSDSGGRSTPVTASALGAAFRHVEEDYLGGYFPLSSNGFWHGGVHLRGGPRAPVYACLDGTVVAARLGPSAQGEYGSSRFLLLRHTWEERPFYSLYMAS